MSVGNYGSGLGEKAVLWWARKTGICLALIGISCMVFAIFIHCNYKDFNMISMFLFVVVIITTILLNYYLADADWIATFCVCWIIVLFILILITLLPFEEIFLGICSVILVIWGLLRISFPDKISKLRKDPSLLYKANCVFDDILYKNDRLIFSPNYIMSAKNKSIIINTNDVFLVCIKSLSINNIPASKRMIFELATGTLIVNVAGIKEENINYMVKLIVNNCPNVRLGLKTDNDAYLRKQRKKWEIAQSEKQRLENAIEQMIILNMSENSVQSLSCKKCGRPIHKDSKLCPSCENMLQNKDSQIINIQDVNSSTIKAVPEGSNDQRSNISDMPLKVNENNLYRNKISDNPLSPNNAGERINVSKINRIDALFPVRYEAEHRAIRDIFFNGSRDDIDAALTPSGLYSIYNFLLEKSNIVNPYRIVDFTVTARMPEENTMIVCAELPEPEQQPLCFRMYFILDGDLNAKALYTIEKGSDNGVFKGYLCQWKGETHANIQPLLETSWISDKDAKAEAELQMIMKAYKNDTDH